MPFRESTRSFQVGGGEAGVPWGLTPRGNDLYLDRGSTAQLGCPLYSVTAADRLESVFFFRYQAVPIDPPK